jgi:ABC-type Zn uptake system ZnuABC Zn-binding protein ZnuA
MIEICFLLSDEFLSCLMNFILLTQITNEQQNMNFECQISIYILKQTSFDVYAFCLNKIGKEDVNVHYIKKENH